MRAKIAWPRGRKKLVRTTAGLKLRRIIFNSILLLFAVPYAIQRISSYMMIDNIDYFSIPVIRCATMFKRIAGEIIFERGRCFKLFLRRYTFKYSSMALLNTSNFERWCMKLKQHQFQLFT